MKYVVEREIVKENGERYTDWVVVEAGNPHEAIVMSEYFYRVGNELVDVVGVYQVSSHNYVEDILKEAFK